jgi:ubiquinone/menaquinone biosynthesis C-methylase UbiE
LNQKIFYDAYHQGQSQHKVTEMLQKERRSVISNMFKDLPGDKRKHVLIVGCGLGEDAETVGMSTVAIDISEIAIMKARQSYPRHTYLVADGESMPFVDNCFGAVVCSEVIEHVQDPPRMVMESYRVLGPNGVLLMTTPNWKSFYGIARWIGELILKRPLTSAEQPIDHWYSKDLLEKLLRQHFTVLQWRGIWFFPPIGLGHKTLPISIMLPLFRLLMPIEWLLQRKLAGYAHLVAVACIKEKAV